MEQNLRNDRLMDLQCSTKPQTHGEKQFLENNQRNDRAVFSTLPDPRAQHAHTHTHSNLTAEGGRWVRGSLMSRASATGIRYLPDCEHHHRWQNSSVISKIDAQSISVK